MIDVATEVDELDVIVAPQGEIGLDVIGDLTDIIEAEGAEGAERAIEGTKDCADAVEHEESDDAKNDNVDILEVMKPGVDNAEVETGEDWIDVMDGKRSEAEGRLIAIEELIDAVESTSDDGGVDELQRFKDLAGSVQDWAVDSDEDKLEVDDSIEFMEADERRAEVNIVED